MKRIRPLLIVLAILTYNIHYAQSDSQDSIEELSLDKGNIDSQFEYIIKKSGNYRADGKKYEVVRVISLDKLRKNVADSINVFTKKASELKATIATHESTITGLNNTLEETSNNLSSVTEEKDSMSFIGLPVSKITYNTILWTIIAGLLGLMLFFMYKFRRSNVLTQEAKTNLSEVEIEFENHRRRALEREQKISRELQDEINKYKKSK